MERPGSARRTAQPRVPATASPPAWGWNGSCSSATRCSPLSSPCSSFAHHGMFGHIRRFDYGLLWLNLIALLTISLVPFPTAMLGARLDADDQFPVAFNAASMTVSSVILTLTWLYARNRRLVDATPGSGELKSFTTRAVVTSVVFLISIGAAFAGLMPAALCWLLMIPAARLAARRLSG